MSVLTEIEDLVMARNIIRTKMRNAGQATSSDKLSTLATNLNIIDTSDATASASDILSPKTAYVNGIKVTGIMTIATPAQITSIVDSIFS